MGFLKKLEEAYHLGAKHILWHVNLEKSDQDPEKWSCWLRESPEIKASGCSGLDALEGLVVELRSKIPLKLLL